MAIAPPPSGLTNTATGAPMTDPLATIAKAHVNAYAAVRGAQQAGGEDPNAQPPVRTIPTDDQSPPPMRTRKIDFGTNPANEEQQGYQDKQDALARKLGNENQLQTQLQTAVADAGRAATFNKDAYTAKRIAEMKPTQDIDDAILQLRQRAVYDQAALWESLQGVPLPKAMEVINQRQSEYTRQIGDLAKIREARLADAKDKINEEVDTYQGQITAAKTKVDALKTSIQAAKDAGVDESAIAQLHIDAAKEAARLNKTRASKNSLATDDEIAVKALEAKGYTKIRATAIVQTTKSRGGDVKNPPSDLLKADNPADEPVTDFINRITKDPKSMSEGDYMRYAKLKKAQDSMQ